MATLQSIFFYLTTTAFFFGPTFRFNLFSASIPILDILLILYTISSLFGKKITNYRFIVFIIWATFSFLINLPAYNLGLKNIFYLIRLANFCLFFSLIPKPTTKQIKYLNLVIIANLSFGLIQYYVWPNLTNYSYLGWDPHLNRLTSTFLDPTFTGIIFLLFLLHCYFSKAKMHILILIYICIALTYSRSTLLSLLVCSLFVSINKKKFYIFIKTSLVVLLTIFILPNTIGEGTNLKRTSTIKAKLENYGQAIHLIIKKPLTGYGYNNLNIIRPIDPKNHASFGFDSSLLTITCTTGIIGLFLFLGAFFKLFKNINLWQKTLLLALFVHSFFSNSLLYPWAYFILLSYFPASSKNHK